ncbi:siderophore-interacting protein [Hylemonella gracilis]|uniref:Siderophore-interacting protein n=1 Tax=Hylemonella gracilis TaxID=80880 RepID=A0A4P6ULT4_9BURK|nr:siderophore-interacting protein [Hylemonella gracilis]QBK05085.1 siderophore-interacting protein [Hylemonella gracilis]
MATPKQLITQILGRLLFEDGHVTRVQTPALAYRRITLEIPAWRGKRFEPGSNFRIAQPGPELRTYTLLSLDSATGQAETLLHLHGQGPGSAWGSTVRAGDAVQVFGPEPSRRAARLAEGRVRTAVFGDETSFGIALMAQSFADSLAVFEVSDVAAAQTVLATLGLERAVLIERQRDGAHLPRTAEALRAALRQLSGMSPGLSETIELVLTGQAQSIQTVRAQLRAAGIDATQTVKPHWAVGKTGLD